MPKDQRTKWREAKERYRERVKTGQVNNNQDQEEDSGDSFWTS